MKEVQERCLLNGTYSKAFDPSSSARLPIAKSHDPQLIVFCSEGHTSSLAAAALQDLGLLRTTDVGDGFQAWRAKGLATL